MRLPGGLSCAVLFLLPGPSPLQEETGRQANRCAFYTGWRAVLSTVCIAMLSPRSRIRCLPRQGRKEMLA